MARRLTYEEVKHFVEVESDSGCKLLSREYVNNSSDIEMECKCGSVFTTTFSSFKSQNKHTCDKCSHFKRVRKFTKKQVNEIISLYKKNNTIKRISEIYKTKEDKISKVLKNNNVPIKNVTDYYTSNELATTRKYKFNRSYFKEVDTCDKAYWLGFLFADGNVHIPEGSTGGSKGGTVELGLKAEDDYHIYNFISCIGGDNPVEYRDVKLNDKQYPSARVQLNSIEMCNDLINKGCVPRKSLTLEPPKGLSEHLTSHFIRGYFDGDGCVGFYENRNAFMLQILGTKPILSWIQTILKNKLITSRIKKDSRGNFFRLDITGRDNFEAFFNYIYKDKKYFLGRKYDKYVDSLLYFDKNPDISEVNKLFAGLVC